MALLEQILNADFMTGEFKDKLNALIDYVNTLTDIPVGVMPPYIGNPSDAALWDANGNGVAGSKMANYALCLGQALTGSLLKNIDGSTKSNAPNMQGKFPVGYDEGQQEFASIGTTGGVLAVTLTVDNLPAHTHKDPLHTEAHGFASVQGSPGSDEISGGGGTNGYISRTGSSLVQPVSVGSSDPFSALPPYLATGFIIRYK